MGVRKLRVLVIEDNNEVRNVLSLILRDRFNAEVLQARTADDAVEACATTQFDVVLMDVYVPGAVECDLIDVIRDGSRCPVVVVTGDSELSPARLGTAEVVLKPFAASEIVAAVSRLGFEAGWHEQRS